MGVDIPIISDAASADVSGALTVPSIGTSVPATISTIAKEPKQNPYADIIRQMQDDLGDMSVLSQASTFHPDKVGEEQRIGDELGLPASIVAVDIEANRRRALLKQIEMQNLAKTSPVLAMQLRDPNFAKIAYDNTPRLSFIEQLFTDIKNIPQVVSTSYEAGGMQDEMGKLGFKELLGTATDQDKARIVELKAQMKANPADDGFWGAAAEVVGQMQPQLVRQTGEAAKSFFAGSSIAAGLTVAGGVAAAPAIATGVAAAGITWRVGMGVETGVSEAGAAYQDMIERGASPAVSKVVATGVGVINGALETFFLGAITAPVRKYITEKAAGVVAKELTKATTGDAAMGFFKNYVVAGLLEGGTEIAQEITAAVGEDIAAAMSDGNLEVKLKTEQGRAEIGERIGGVFVKTLKAMTLLGLPVAGVNFAADNIRAKEAARDAKFLTDLTDQSTDNPVRDRNPRAYETFIGEQAEGGKAENVYLDAEQVTNVLNQAGLSVAELEKVIPNIAEQLQEAVASGGDVTIPIAQYAARIAGTDVGNALLPHMRLAPDAMSIADVKVFEQNRAELLEQAKQIVEQREKTDTTFTQSARKVENQIFDQIKQTGTYTDRVAKNYSEFVRDFIVTQAAKANMMPHEFYEKYMYKIEGQKSLPEGVQMFEQARKKAQLEINQTVDELVDAANSQSSWRDWYKQHEDALNKMFGSDSDLFQKLLSVTSQAASVASNVGLAIKAYDQYLSGAEFTGYLPAVIGNLNRIRADEAMKGQKIAQYGEANEGNADAVAVDRHIAMLFFDVKSPSPAQVEIAKQRIREVAQRLGWEARQVQAALWAFNQVRLGADPKEVVSYDTILERKADLIAALRTRHGRGEGGGIQAGSEAVQRSEEGAGTGTAGAVFNQQSIEAREEAETNAKIAETQAIASQLEAEGATNVKPIIADQLIEDKDVPLISIKDMLGMTMFPTIADRTAAGALFHGIDSSKLQLAIQLLGGPFFPLRETNIKSKVAWANRGKSVMAQKARRLKEGANYMLIVLGDPDMHQSNTTVSNAFFATLEAYVTSGRITTQDMDSLTNLVRKKFKKDFPYIGNIKELDAYVHTLSFEARKRLLDVVGLKEAQRFGAPSMKKILDATRQTELSSHRWGDGVVLVKVDNEKPFVNLGEEGTMAHPDFPLGLRGEIVGKLNVPLNYELLWKDWIDQFNANKSQFFDIMTSPEMTSLSTWEERKQAIKSSASNKENGISDDVKNLVLQEIKNNAPTKKNPDGEMSPAEYDASLLEGTNRIEDAKDKFMASLNSRRAFEMAKPALKITPELVARLEDIRPSVIDGNRQAQLAVNMALDQWKTSDNKIKEGGASPQGFVDAVKNSDAVSTLDEYGKADVDKGIRAKTLRLFQLGDENSGIWFALKKGNPATGYGLEIAGLSDKDITLTAVINNEQGARGIAAPAVVLKAIEEGASVLDAFAVRSSKFPNGFLPELYSLFGFEVVGELPFDPQYYDARKLADAEAFWSKGGWNKETDGYPPVVIMKWMGTDAERKGITERYLRDGIEGLLAGRNLENAEADWSGISRDATAAAGEGGATSDTGRAGGDQGTRNRASLASRAQSIARSIGELSDLEAANLGISTSDRDAVRNLLDSGAIYNQRGIEPTGIGGEAAGDNGQFAQQTRGGFDPKRLTTILNEKADYSTFLHETAHFFLTVYADMAVQPNATEQMKADMQTVLDWFGVKDIETWNAMSLEQQRKYHEQWAYSYEIYLFEGKSPSAKMEGVFEKFSAWLRRVYQSIRDDLNALYRQENGVDLPILTGEVRQVMDRMLASEAQIKQAEQMRQMMPMFQDQKLSGMDDNAWAAYQQMAAEAHEQSVQNLTTASLRNMKWLGNAKSRILKQMQKEHAQDRANERAVIAAEVADEPVYRVGMFLRRGELTVASDASKEQRRFATETGMEGTKLSLADLKQMYGEEGNAIWRNLPNGKYGLVAQEGLHPDVVASQFGFTSGDQMIRALLAARPFNEEVDARTDQVMLEKYSDMSTPAQVAAEVDKALHNEARTRFAAVELRAVAKAIAPVRVMVNAARAVAKQIIEGKKITDIKPKKYSAEETKANRAAANALKKSNTPEAVKALQTRLLNNLLTIEATAAEADVKKGVAYFSKVQDAKSIKRMGADNFDQVAAILYRFGLGPEPQKQVAERKTLTQWMDQQEENGRVPDIAEAILNENYRKPYTEMTVAEFAELIDAVKQIEHLGRTEQNMLTSAKNASYKEARDEMVSSINLYAGGRTADARTPTTEMGRKIQMLKRFYSSHIKASSIARILDGGKDGGPVWNYLIRTANTRADMETTMRAEATAELSRLFEPVLKQGKMGGSGKYFETVNRSFNRESAITIALNMGNSGNLQRLLGGEGWTIDQVMPILKSLTAAELEAVNGVWAYFEKIRPLVSEKERRVNGKEPKWVEPTPFTVVSSDGKTVQMTGGYYPVKYDPQAGIRAEQFNAAEAARRQLNSAYTSATTRRSYTKARVEEVVGRPLIYTLAGMYSGFNDVIHDLAWHEWLIDANKILRSKSIDVAIRNQYGPEFKTQLTKWVSDIAEGERGIQMDGEIALDVLRRNVSIGGLGFNVMSAALQITGFNQSIVRLGAGWMGRGIAIFSSNPKRASLEAAEKSQFMADRSRTQFRELNELQNIIQGKSTALRSIQMNAYLMMTKMQQVVDVPTWHGAYEKALHEGRDEETSIAIADQTVIDTQGSGLLKDLAQVQRGGSAMKIFTVFYNYMSTTMNMAVVQGMTEKSKAKLAADYALLFVAPVVLNHALKAFLQPSGGDDEPWDWNKIAKSLAAEQLSYLMGMMIIARELGDAGKIVFGAEGKDRGYGGPAGTRMISDVFELLKETSQGKLDAGFRKSVINIIGDFSGLPSAQINRTWTGIEAIVDEKTRNPMAVVTGYAKK
jgi:hypothetical protein